MRDVEYGRLANWPSNWQALTPAQKGMLRSHFIRRARRARAFALRRLLLGWARFLRRRRYARDLAALSAMDDMMLKDIGVSRSQVRGAMLSGIALKRSR
jgi:uncharacterized protein YjiS (DUF1127 family)